MPWDDTALLVVTGGITRKLKDLCTEILKHGSQVHRSTSPCARSILALLQIPANTTNRELQSGFGRRTGALLFATSSFSLAWVLRRSKSKRLTETTIGDFLTPDPSN